MTPLLRSQIALVLALAMGTALPSAASAAAPALPPSEPADAGFSPDRLGDCTPFTRSTQRKA